MRSSRRRPRRIPAIAILLGLVPVTACAAAPRLLVGESHPIPTRFPNHPVVEPHVSAHPSEDGHLLVGAMIVTDADQPYRSCRLSSFVSGDAGATWTETAHDWWGYDPWTAIDESGRAVLTWLGTEGSFQDRYPVVFLSSDDAGVRWNDDVQVTDGNHDGTKVTALGETFAFTAVHFVQRGADVVLQARRRDEPFREIARVPGNGRRLNFCEPAILSDGTIVVPASEFLERAWVHRVNPATGEMSEAYPVTDRPGGAGGYLRLVADTSPESPFRDRLHFVRALGSRERYEGIWINTSSDGGRTWSEDRRVDVFAEGPETRAVLATVAVNRDGVVAISWVDRRRADEELRDVYVTASLDGGETFLPPARVTGEGSSPRTEANADAANKFSAGGHYMGMAARAGGAFQLVWSDSRSGHFGLRTAEVRVTG